MLVICWLIKEEDESRGVWVRAVGSGWAAIGGGCIKDQSQCRPAQRPGGGEVTIADGTPDQHRRASLGVRARPGEFKPVLSAMGLVSAHWPWDYTQPS